MLGSFPFTDTGSLTLQVQQLHHQAIRGYTVFKLLSHWIGTSHSCQQYRPRRLLQELLKKCKAPGSSKHSNFWHLEACVQTVNTWKLPLQGTHNDLKKPSRRMKSVVASLAALMEPCGQPRCYRNWSGASLWTLRGILGHIEIHDDPCACHWSPMTNEVDGECSIWFNKSQSNQIVKVTGRRSTHTSLASSKLHQWGASFRIGPIDKNTSNVQRAIECSRVLLGIMDFGDFCLQLCLGDF